MQISKSNSPEGEQVPETHKLRKTKESNCKLALYSQSVVLVLMGCPCISTLM